MLAELSEMDSGLAPYGNLVVERWSAGASSRAHDAVAEEVPVALVFNGLSHAVMLATPQDLEDFAIGFSLSEGIVAARSDIFSVEIESRESGVELGLHVAASCQHALKARRRALAGRTGCGLCGVESLEQAICRPSKRVSHGRVVSHGALVRAQRELSRMQKLFALTGAVHAAAWCRWDGEVVCVREDVGRHNALDKVIGALAVAGEDFGAGFAVLTSRASYEIACKAAAVGIGLVATVSAPTGMAVRVAEEAGMTLIGFLRDDRFSVYANPSRVCA